jgi:chemotaxis signal transduction protein
MSTTGLRSAAQLRQEFDTAFSRPPPAQADPAEDHLAIRLGPDAHAVALAEIAALAPLRALARLPGPLPELLGVAGWRGTIRPVYDLAALLGYAPASAPRWLVWAAVAPVGLAFETLEGHLRVPCTARARPDGDQPARRHVHAVLHTGGGVRPVVALVSVLEALRAAAARVSVPPEESLTHGS